MVATTTTIPTTITNAGYSHVLSLVFFFGVHLGGGIEQIETELFHFETHGT
jgi:hypothetical protein